MSFHLLISRSIYMAISKISRRHLLRSALAAPTVLGKWPALAQQARAILNQTMQLPPPSQLPAINEWPDPFYLNLHDFSGLKQYPGPVRCTTKGPVGRASFRTDRGV